MIVLRLIRTLFAATAVQAFGELEYEIGTGVDECGLHFFICGVRIAEQQVFPYGTAKEGISLGDVGEVGAGTCMAFGLPAMVVV